MTRQQEGDEAARCEICDWPLKQRMEDGCVEGNCSYRPREGSAEYYRIRRRRKELAEPLPTPEETTLPAKYEEINLKQEVQFPGMAGLPYRVVYNGNSLMSICSDADKVVVAKPPAIPEGRHTYFQAEEREGKSMQFMVYAANRHHALTDALKAITAERDALKAEVDFFSRETMNFQINAGHRARQLADELRKYDTVRAEELERLYKFSVSERLEMELIISDLRKEHGAVVGQETPQDIWRRGYETGWEAHGSKSNHHVSHVSAPSYTPPLKAGTE